MAAAAPKTALFAWEIGEGLGHVPNLKAIAGGLQERGWRVVFAVRDPATTSPALRELSCPIWTAPHWPNPVAPAKPSYSYSDILAANGFAREDDLRALLAGWDSVLDAAKADLVVCEHAPGAAAAAFGVVPVAIVGNGFLVPPADGADFPIYREGGDGGLQARVLAVTQEALAERGQPKPAAVTEPFRGAFRAVYSFPELDPYRALRRDPVLGPLEAMPAISPLPRKRQVFAYSTSDLALIEELTMALMELGPSAAVYFRGRQSVRGAVLKSRGVTVFGEAPALGEVIPRATCVFSHAGSGVTAAAFAAGRPQILNPRHGEASTTARLLEELGVGLSLVPLERKALLDAIERMHGEGHFAAQAQLYAEGAHKFLKCVSGLEKTIAALTAIVG